MTTTDGGSTQKCWMVAGAIGLVVALFALSAHKGIVAAILLGLIACGLLGALFNWLFNAPVPKLGAAAPRTPSVPPIATEAAAGLAGPATTPAGTTAKSETAAEIASAAEAVEETEVDLGDAAGVPDSVAPEMSEGTSSGDSAVKPSKPLAGEQELSERKGSWKYEGEAEAPAEEGEGTRPEALSAPREGGADNLKEIKGVGPKLEELLHELGVYHFDQIAGWSAAEVAWMDGNLKGFRGRVSRDDWIGQAKILAAGGDTDFSKRVDQGDVY